MVDFTLGVGAHVAVRVGDKLVLVFEVDIGNVVDGVGRSVDSQRHDD